MYTLSKRHKQAAIEKSQAGIGVTTTARMFARNHFKQQGNEQWAQARNDKINDWIAMDFMASEPIHLFKLKTGEIAEMRKSQGFIYIGKRVNGSYVIITLQSTHRPVKQEISRRRLEEWK